MENLNKEYFEKLIGKNIEIKFINSIDLLCTRKGRVEIDKGWMYLYGEYKSGNNYNSAFKLDEYEFKRIRFIKEI